VQRQNTENDERDAFGQKKYPMTADRPAKLITGLPNIVGASCRHDGVSVSSETAFARLRVYPAGSRQRAIAAWLPLTPR
jgi:hypothetical protein